ncbi:hypothetical protein BE04_49745, partial [Sorangium cellulosum]
EAGGVCSMLDVQPSSAHTASIEASARGARRVGRFEAYCRRAGRIMGRDCTSPSRLDNPMDTQRPA